jgi:hypothetical protein
VLSKSPDCSLPDVPGALPDPVGFPAPDGKSIYLSKSDWALVVARDVEIRAWMQAAIDCMKAQR